MAGLWERWRRRSGMRSPVGADPADPASGGDIETTTSPPPATPQPPEQNPPSGEGAHAVTRERIARALASHRYRVLRDDDGDLSGLWDYRLFSFYLVREQVLQIRGQWTRQGAIGRLAELLAFTDTWNAARLYPKGYVRVRDDGRIHVMCEVSVPLLGGLTDEQLDTHLGVGLAAGSAFFDELDRTYPDPLLSEV